MVEVEKSEEIEGRVAFTISKISEFEGKQIYILTNSSERRLVECEKYKDFGLKIGDRVETDLKKANCAGNLVTQIYHPRYKTGEDYDFEIKEMGIVKMGGFEMPFLDLCDGNGFYQRIRINDEQLTRPNKKARCRITGMSRGKLHLLLLDE